jgi:NTP pyrophosphatase (non-canonical NTP hydrolase)
MTAPLTLPPRASLAELGRYIHALEDRMGWLDVDLVHTAFFLGEEVGELFKAIRRYERRSIATDDPHPDGGKAEVADEIVDVLNYLLAIANRLDIDVEAAFLDKNTRNQGRTWT